MNILLGITLFIVGMIIGFCLFLKGMDEFFDINNDKTPLQIIFWCFVAAIGFCIMPASFLYSQYIMFVLKP